MSEAAAKKPQEPKNDQAAGEPKPKADIISLAIVGLMTVNLLAVGGMGMFMKKVMSRVQDVQNQVAHMATPEPVVAEEKEKEKPIGHEMAPPVQGTLYPMESFLVNISSEQGPKFLQTQMELELADPALEDEITRKKAAIRDAVIVLLSSRSYKDLRDSGGMKKLRQDILRSINNLLSTGKVRELYFTQFHFN
jgi:flagellar protein FliL